MAEKNKIFTKNIVDMEAQYAQYINDHIENVQEAFKNTSVVFNKVFPEVFNDDNQLGKLNANLYTHDESKFSTEEFTHYGNKFFPIEGTDPNSEVVNNNFKIAWLHHLHNNPHHPGYWVLVEGGKIELLDMPDIYIIEMLCDWMAMSKYYNSSTLDYWNSESAAKLPMSHRTIFKVNEFMEAMTKFSKENNIIRW